MSSSSPDLKAVEDLWRQRVADAKLRLDFAKNYASEVRGDLPAGHVPPADGNFATERAIRGETLALAEYTRILRIYTDLIMHGTIPSDEIRHSPSTAHFRCSCGKRLVFSTESGAFTPLEHLERRGTEKRGRCPGCHQWHSVLALPKPA